MQIKFIFIDNDRILCLSCNVNNNSQIVWKERKTINILTVSMVFSKTSARILLASFIVVLHESGTRKALLGPWLNSTEVYLTPLLVLKKTWISDPHTHTHTQETNPVICYTMYYRLNSVDFEYLRFFFIFPYDPSMWKLCHALTAILGFTIDHNWNSYFAKILSNEHSSQVFGQMVKWFKIIIS